MDIDAWMGTLVSIVRNDKEILTTRQIAILMRVCTSDESQTIRGLSVDLNIPPPAVVRSVDRLEALYYVRRVEDPRSLRSVLIHPAASGMLWVQLMSSRINKTSEDP